MTRAHGETDEADEADEADELDEATDERSDTRGVNPWQLRT
jgi:nitric oxide reductase activation protein